jgi:hypothetical protein
MVRLAALHLPSPSGEGHRSPPARNRAWVRKRLRAKPMKSITGDAMTGTGMRRTGKGRSRPAPQAGEPRDSEDDHMRAACRALGFWRVCGKAPCRRALDCKGDAQACFRTFWRQLPEHVRVWVRAAIRASASGLRNRAAAKVADAEVERWRALQMRFAPKAASPQFSERPVEAPEPADIPVPRIRSL